MPFCGSGGEPRVVERWREEDDPEAVYPVECVECGYNGPQAATEEAAEGWNGRNGQPATAPRERKARVRIQVVASCGDATFRSL